MAPDLKPPPSWGEVGGGPDFPPFDPNGPLGAVLYASSRNAASYLTTRLRPLRRRFSWGWKVQDPARIYCTWGQL
jgi:hypothetical protein